MSEQISVKRVVNQEDYTRLIYLITDLAEYERLTPPSEEKREKLTRDGIAMKYEACLAIASGKPIGYVVFFPHYSTFNASQRLWIEDIFVLDAHRHTGAGKALLNFCKEEAKRRDFESIDFVVLGWNAHAMKFFERNGAKRQTWTYFTITKEDF
ncbi:GNAT family N-acetyltransferase [Candidatus Woesearchaeota archaeon]|nr:GNAT family N-acetyltransferase [Candidatus Woesearchaeota archaeon]